MSPWPISPTRGFATSQIRKGAPYRHFQGGVGRSSSSLFVRSLLAFVSLCSSVMSVSRSTFARTRCLSRGRRFWGARTDFDCNPIATQRDIMERHNLIRAEPPPMRMPANKAFSLRSGTAQIGRDRIQVPVIARSWGFKSPLAHWVFQRSDSAKSRTTDFSGSPYSLTTPPGNSWVCA
jgi:hypothetical protein